MKVNRTPFSTPLLPTLLGLAFVIALCLVPTTCFVGCKKAGTPQTAGTGPAPSGNTDFDTSNAPSSITPVDPVTVREGKSCTDSVGHEYPDGYKYAVGTKDNTTHFECRDGQFVELAN